MLRKRLKKYLCIFTIMLIVAQCGGCAPIQMVLQEVYGNDAVAAAEAIPYIGFSVEEELDQFEKKEASEFSQIENAAKTYSNDFFYKILSAEEQMIYNAYLYAMEHGYMNVLIDEKLATDSETLIYVLECLSCDSPLLEQNLRYELTYFTSQYGVDILGVYGESATFQGICIRVYNFAEELWAKKLQAIEEAKRIVEELPTNLSQKEKAKELYSYIRENVKYKEYKKLQEMYVGNYLYDALIKKKSHCDGVTNALALLFKIANINSLEKTYSAGEDEVGHTWNMFELDGNWYNADAVSNPKDKKSDKQHRLNLYFGFSDDLQIYTPDRSEQYPQSGKSLNEAKLYRLKNVNASKFVTMAVKELKKKEPYLIVLLDKYDESQMYDQMQRVVNELQGEVKWYIYASTKEWTVIYIYR